MSLYDVIDHISARQVAKSETGDPRMYGVAVGIVAKNYDQEMPGRLCVTIPTRDKDAAELQWARVMMPSSGKEWGHYFLPEVGDQVLLAFEGGDIEKPYVLGCVPLDRNKFLTKSVDENNQIKRIVTRHGSTLTFEDSQEGEGEKDKITLQTAGEAHTIQMDNERKTITVTDKEKKNQLVMDTDQGNMTIKAGSRLTIQVGDTIKLTLNGESGAVSIEATEVRIKANKQIALSTDGMLKAEAAQLSANASSMLKLESSGMATLSGSPIKIG